MFQSSAKRVRAWLQFADDILGLTDDILGDGPAAAPQHPHRLPLRWDRPRRPGSVPARPAHCISPVRGRLDKGGRDRVTS